MQVKNYSLTTVAVCQYTMYLVVYISASPWLSAHKTLVYSIRVSQGSVATRLRCGETF